MLIGLVVPDDQHAAESQELVDTWAGELYTTSFVVAEAATRLAKGKHMRGRDGQLGRELAVLLVRDVLTENGIEIVHPDAETTGAARAAFAAFEDPYGADLFDFTTREVIRRRSESMVGSPDAHFESWGIERVM